MYNTTFFTGDYKWRQTRANNSNLDIYIEYHFNYYSNTTNYTLCKIANDTDTTSLKFAQTHAKLASDKFNVPVYSKEEDSEAMDGVILCKRSGRNYFNISLIKAPAVILEPLFLSNPTHVNMILKQDGLQKLATVLVDSIVDTFPSGANVGFSVGHKYQRSNPMDRGALAVSSIEYTEADLSDTVLTLAKVALDNL